MKSISRASFRTFLGSGALGVLRPGMITREAAENLGPPGYWSYYRDKSEAADFWAYKQLELNFSDRSPRKIERIQIPRASDLRGRQARLADRLVLGLGDLHGEMSPADFIRAEVWPQGAIEIDVQLIAGELQLRLGCRPVQLLYVIGDDNAAGQPEMIDTFHRGDWHALAPFFEKRATLHSVTAYSNSAWRQRHWSAPKLDISTNGYLELCKA